MITNLEEALKYISELEVENKALREELEQYKNMKPAGRKKHDDTWRASYNDFVVKYESGKSIMEIVNQGEISRRTAYRYKTYYDEMVKQKKHLQQGRNQMTKNKIITVQNLPITISKEETDFANPVMEKLKSFIREQSYVVADAYIGHIYVMNRKQGMKI